MEERDESQTAMELIQQAWAARRENRVVEAHVKLVEAVSICRRSGAQRELAMALGKLGHVEEDLGNGDAAFAAYEERVAICREEDDPLALAHAVRHLGDVHRKAGRQENAETCYHEALSIYRNHKQPPKCDLANAIRPMAILREELGQVDQARQLWTEARELYEAVNVQAGVDECSDRLAGLSR